VTPAERTARLAPALAAWYARDGRRHLPWRRTRDPYRVTVSEIMLQQTQVERVIPLYEAFLARFPDIAALATSDAGDVLRMWRGLGYNSRALRLHAFAREVVATYAGDVPRDRALLLALPGIGPYTASAIRAFAFDEPDAANDVNLRRVAHRAYHGIEHPPLATPAVLDARAGELVAAIGGHDGNSALMDLGATLCTARAPKCLLCPLVAACAAAPIDGANLAHLATTHAKPRSPQEALPFEKTTRFVRGRIVDRLRALEPGTPLIEEKLYADLQPIVQRDRPTFFAVVDRLVRDGIVERRDIAGVSCVLLPSVSGGSVASAANAHRSNPSVLI
jgi:A/G-specific adenine glycosylase